jgi:hypothetical protein
MYKIPHSDRIKCGIKTVQAVEEILSKILLHERNKNLYSHFLAMIITLRDMSVNDAQRGTGNYTMYVCVYICGLFSAINIYIW